MNRLAEGDAEDLIPAEKALDFLPRFVPQDFFATLMRNGCEIAVKKMKNVPNTLCRVYKNDEFIGLGHQFEKDGETLFKVVTHLWE